MLHLSILFISFSEFASRSLSLITDYIFTLYLSLKCSVESLISVCYVSGWVYLSFHFPDPRACSSRSFYLSTHLAVNGAGGADPTHVPERGSIFWVPKLLGGVPLMSPEGCLHATDDDTHPFLQQWSASNCVHAGGWRGEDPEHPSCRRWLHGYHRWQAGTWIFSVMKLS